MITKKKKLRPVDIEGYIKYICHNCLQEHWVSFKEAKHPKFVIVCRCDETLKVKTVESISIKHIKRHNKNNTVQPSGSAIENSGLVNKTRDVLLNYGFSKTEADSLISSACEKQNFTNCEDLIKCVLTKFGESSNVK
jgi:hypothetical protein